MAQNKDSVPGGNKENAMHNPAYNINAALTYATQLVNIIAYYLDVRLPYKLAYRFDVTPILTPFSFRRNFIFNIFSSYSILFLRFSEFYGSEMSDQKFTRKVARLNSNILHLCFTQNTDTSVLHPMHTLQNLMHLLNTEISDLGRYVDRILIFINLIQ